MLLKWSRLGIWAPWRTSGVHGLLTTPPVFSCFLYLSFSLNESCMVGHSFKPLMLFIDCLIQLTHRVVIFNMIRNCLWRFKKFVWCLKCYVFLIGGLLPHSVVLAPVSHQHESAIGDICSFPSELFSHLKNVYDYTQLPKVMIQSFLHGIPFKKLKEYSN